MFVSDDGPDDTDDEPQHWFQLDADQDLPMSSPVTGRGLVVGYYDRELCNAHIGLEELTAHITFARSRKVKILNGLAFATVAPEP
jgi:hypothetical protein